MLLKIVIPTLCSLLPVSAAVHKRIVNPVAAEPGEFPWIVSIQTAGRSHNCGGVLLDSTTVLTAAHCTDDRFSRFVRAGSLDSTDGGVYVEVLSRKNHPEHQSGYVALDDAGSLSARDADSEATAPDTDGQPVSNDGQPVPDDDPFGLGTDPAAADWEAQRRLYEPNDIAVMKLKTPIPESDTIAYAKLPTSGSDPAANSTAVLAGWGSTTDVNGSPVVMLNKAAISVLARDHCREFAPEAGDRDTVVCTDGNHKNSCLYDSGGPLVDEQKRQVIGVVSFGLPGKSGEALKCGEAPTMYTRVASYIPFILENMGVSS